MRIVIASLLSLCATSATLAQSAKIDFAKDIWPILEAKCVDCHKAAWKDDTGRTRNPKAGLRLDGSGWILKGSDDGPILVKNEPLKSSLYARTVLPPEHEDIMPPKEEPLTKVQARLLHDWIARGADFGAWQGAAGGLLVPKKQAPTPTTVVAKPSPWAVTLEQRAAGLKPLPETQLSTFMQTMPGSLKPVYAQSPLLTAEFLSDEADVTDAAILRMAPVATHVVELNLAKTKVTDASMNTIARWPRLTRLNLSRTAVTDQGLKALRQLKTLQMLNLFGTAITDQSIEAIGSIPDLKEVTLWQTQITSAGVTKLKQQRPEVHIVHNPTLPEPEKDDPDKPRRKKR